MWNIRIFEYDLTLSLSLSLSLSLYHMQFHISNPTNASHVRTVQLPLASLENITRMVASDNGEYIFAMTPSRVSEHLK